MGCPSRMVTSGVRRLVGKLLEDRALVVPLPGPRLVRAEEEVCAGDADDVGPDAVRVGKVAGTKTLIVLDSWSRA